MMQPKAGGGGMQQGAAIPPRFPDTFPLCAGMPQDIELLKMQSPVQQDNDSHYMGLPQKTMIVVEYVTDTALKFMYRPQVFPGSYAGRFCPLRSYPYFDEADIGGKRYYIVRDNYGVWVSFLYIVPI